MIPCNYDEDFTGSSFDTDLWTEYDPYGIQSCVNNVSFFSGGYTPQHQAYLSGQNKGWNVSGDFNLQIDIIFGIYNNAYPRIWYSAGFFLYHYVDASNYCYIYLQKPTYFWQGNLYVGYYIVTGGASSSGSVALGTSALDYDYKLKIVRSTATFQFYYWKDGTWNQIGGNVATQYTGSGYLVLKNFSGTYGPTVYAQWTLDNLVFNSGCPTSTSTSSTSSSTSSTSTSSTSTSSTSSSTSSTSSSTSSTSTSSTSSSTSSTSSSSSSTSTSSSTSSSTSTSTTTIMDFRKAKLSRQLDKSYLKISKYR